MADHHAPSYSTAAGNDYPEHQRTYDMVVKMFKVGIVSVVALLICIAASTMGHIGLIGAPLGFLWLVATAIGLFSRNGNVIPLVGVAILTLLAWVLMA